MALNIRLTTPQRSVLGRICDGFTVVVLEGKFFLQCEKKPKLKKMKILESTLQALINKKLLDDKFEITELVNKRNKALQTLKSKR